MKQTCGPLYLEALTQYTEGDPEKVRLFAAGFVSGQAEKVYLGACLACMFRPSETFAPLVLELAADAAKRYGLVMTRLDDEFWLCRNTEVRVVVESLADAERNSPAWHSQRAMLCGVPQGEVDTAFHKRKGWGKACDLVAADEGAAR